MSAPHSRRGAEFSLFVAIFLKVTRNRFSRFLSCFLPSGPWHCACNPRRHLVFRGFLLLFALWTLALRLQSSTSPSLALSLMPSRKWRLANAGWGEMRWQVADSLLNNASLGQLEFVRRVIFAFAKTRAIKYVSVREQSVHFKFQCDESIDQHWSPI